MEESDVVNVLYRPSFNSGSGLAASRKVHALACQERTQRTGLTPCD